MTPEQFARVRSEAVAWVGTPYHHAAALRGVGVDCGRLVIEIFAGAGLIERFVPADYPHDWHLHQRRERYLEHVAEYADEIEAPEPGGLVVMRYGFTYSHGAVVLEDGEIIHAFVGRPVERAALTDFMGKKMKFFRVRT